MKRFAARYMRGGKTYDIKTHSCRQEGYASLCWSAQSFAEIKQISSFAVGASSIQQWRSISRFPFCQISFVARFSALETAAAVRFLGTFADLIADKLHLRHIRLVFNRNVNRMTQNAVTFFPARLDDGVYSVLNILHVIQSFPVRADIRLQHF